MRIVHAETGTFHHIRRISFYSIDHDEFNPAPVTGNVLLRDHEGPLQPGSYLLPDNDNGLGYLEAVRRVFGLESPAVAADTVTDVRGGR